MASELKLQAQCFQWSWNTYPLERGRLFRVKNELDAFAHGKRLIQVSQNLATGVIPGVSDFIYVGYNVAFIELKTGTVQSAAQKVFQSLVETLGHKYLVIFSFVEFQEEYKKLIYEDRRIAQRALAL
jgi:hypothetical protein